MAHLQYLVFNNENIPMPASYSVSLSDGKHHGRISGYGDHEHRGYADVY